MIIIESNFKYNDKLLNVKYLSSISDLSLQPYLKYSDPRQSDVVKRDSALKRVFVACRAVCVVLVPVDTGVVCRGVIAVEPCRGITFDALVFKPWQAGTVPHSRLRLFATDEVSWRHTADLLWNIVRTKICTEKKQTPSLTFKVKCKINYKHVSK